jgi:hypothetical protein
MGARNTRHGRFGEAEAPVSRVVIASAAAVGLGLALADQPTGGGCRTARMMAARPTGRMVSLWRQEPPGSMK